MATNAQLRANARYAKASVRQVSLKFYPAGRDPYDWVRFQGFGAVPIQPVIKRHNVTTAVPLLYWRSVMNKLEIVFDFDKLAEQKIRDITDLEKLVDSTCIAAGLRKEGSFYIEDNPDSEDGLGAVMAVAFVLMENEEFRHCVKTLRCYWWDDRDREFEMEDLGIGVMTHWDQYKKGDLSFEKVKLPEKVLTPHNKIEIIIDDELIEKEGRITVKQAHDCIDAAAIESMGLRKEGDFYIEDNPQDGFGKVLSLAMFLAKRSWFKHYARKMVCYWWNEDWQDFEAEDVLDTLVINPSVVK